MRGKSISRRLGDAYQTVLALDLKTSEVLYVFAGTFQPNIKLVNAAFRRVTTFLNTPKRKIKIEESEIGWTLSFAYNDCQLITVVEKTNGSHLSSLTGGAAIRIGTTKQELLPAPKRLGLPAPKRKLLGLPGPVVDAN